MKKAVSIFIVLISFILLPLSQAYYANEIIDVNRSSSLTVHYSYDNEPFEGIEIKTYRVASINENGLLTLIGVYADFPISLDGITSQSEWRQICSTLSAYIIADEVKADHTTNTDKEGKAVFSDILPGLYLTLSVSAKSEEKIVIFENFLTVVPRMEQDGKYNYNGVAYPKYTSYVPEPVEVTYKVVKQWMDINYEKYRPEYVDVDIMRDGKFWETKRLSAENNWSYSWTMPNNESTWTAVERNVPNDYLVMISNDGNTIVITNIFEDYGGDLPVTGETIVLWPYILAIGISGGIMTLLAFWRKRIEE